MTKDSLFIKAVTLAKVKWELQPMRMTLKAAILTILTAAVLAGCSPNSLTDANEMMRSTGTEANNSQALNGFSVPSTNTASGFPNTASGFPNTASGFPNTASGFPNTASGFPNAAPGFSAQNVETTSLHSDTLSSQQQIEITSAQTTYPAPLPGECYAQITIDPIYETVVEEVVVEEARTETRIIPAVFGDVQEEVIVREQAVELAVIPAIYRTIVDDIIIRPEARRVIPVEPVYETVVEQVEIVPARAVWKPGRGPIERIDNMTGQILCLVEEPAVYETVERRVLVTPASTREEIIPAVTESITREIIDQPARVEEEIIPAETKLVTRRVQVQPAREEIIEIPAVTRTITRENLARQAHTEWRSILCETNTTPDVVRRIQTALNERGFPVGAVDGVLGTRTANAIDGFQRANGMSGSGITMETLSLLGLNVTNQSIAAAL